MAAGQRCCRELNEFDQRHRDGVLRFPAHLPDGLRVLAMSTFLPTANPNPELRREGAVALWLALSNGFILQISPPRVSLWCQALALLKPTTALEELPPVDQLAVSAQHLLVLFRWRADHEARATLPPVAVFRESAGVVTLHSQLSPAFPPLTTLDPADHRIYAEYLATPRWHEALILAADPAAAERAYAFRCASIGLVYVTDSTGQKTIRATAMVGATGRLLNLDEMRQSPTQPHLLVLMGGFGRTMGYDWQQQTTLWIREEPISGAHMTYMDGYLSLSHQGRYFWLCWDETWVVDLTKPPPSPEEIWKEGRSPPHHIISGALCEDTTTIVVGHSYGNLSALDFDGQVLWSTPVADSPIRTVAATASLIAWRSECGRFGVQNMVDGSTLMNVTHLTGPLHDFLKEALAKTTTSASHGVSE